jgi:hypothetical protein
MIFDRLIYARSIVAGKRTLDIGGAGMPLKSRKTS